MTAMTKDEMLKLCRSKLRTALVLYCTELYFEHAKEHRQKNTQQKQNLSLKQQYSKTTLFGTYCQIPTYGGQQI